MFKLIQNEMIKIFSKVSTYIMLGILLVLLVGVSALMKLSGSYSYSGYTYTEQDIQSELDYLNSSKPDGYEVQVAEYEYMLASGREWNTDSWEFEALERDLPCIPSGFDPDPGGPGGGDLGLLRHFDGGRQRPGAL